MATNIHPAYKGGIALLILAVLIYIFVLILDIWTVIEIGDECITIGLWSACSYTEDSDDISCKDFPEEKREKLGYGVNPVVPAFAILAILATAAAAVAASVIFFKKNLLIMPKISVGLVLCAFVLRELSFVVYELTTHAKIEEDLKKLSPLGGYKLSTGESNIFTFVGDGALIVGAVLIILKRPKE